MMIMTSAVKIYDHEYDHEYDDDYDDDDGEDDDDDDEDGYDEEDNKNHTMIDLGESLLSPPILPDWLNSDSPCLILIKSFW